MPRSWPGRWLVEISNKTTSLKRMSALPLCVINAVKDQDIAVINIPNAFVHTGVKDEEHCAIVCIRGPLVDILASIAPDVYGPFASMLVQCLNAVYGTMVAILLY
jgi:hypothetical protein